MVVSHPVRCGPVEQGANSLGHLQCRGGPIALRRNAPRHLAWLPQANALPLPHPGASSGRVPCLSTPASGGICGASLVDTEQPNLHVPRPLPPPHSTAAAHATASSVHSMLSTAQLLRWLLPVADDGGEPGDVPPPEDWHRHPGLLSGCEPERAPLRVAVLLSGGVDSSLALRLLQAAGHAVTAFYLQIWFQEDFRNSWGACPWEEDLAFCTQVCDAAGVPLEVVPLTAEYWDRVVSHSLAEVRAGRTPNPDVWCNSRVKFGAFYEYLDRHHGDRFDRVASGHYARVIRGSGLPSSADGSSADAAGTTWLAMTADAVKDQTYFLAQLTQAQLSRVLFPLGPLTKSTVRRLAAAAGLATQGRKDSQGICFLGKVRHSEFLAEHLGEWPGPIVDQETGAVLGYHRGFWFHTIGQRKGIPLHGGPWYCVRKDARMNTVYVSRQYFSDDKPRDMFRCEDLMWIMGRLPDPGQQLQVKVRHGPVLYDCTISLEDSQSASYSSLGSNNSSSWGRCSEPAGSALDRPSREAEQRANIVMWHAQSSSAAVDPVDKADSSRQAGPGYPSGSCAETGIGAAAQPLQMVAVSAEQRTEMRPQPCSTAVVKLACQDQGLAPGQFAVFYQRGVCVGSGVIAEAL